MSIDWRAADKIRVVQGKRRAIEVLDAQIAEAERDLETAQSFEGEFSERLAAVERRIGQIAPAWSMQGLVRPFNPANAGEMERLHAERAAIERERNDQIKARTIKGRDQIGRELTYCPLRTGDVQRRLTALRVARGRTVQELSDLEGALSPGQLVQSGAPAPDYAAHTARTAALRGEMAGSAS